MRKKRPFADNMATGGFDPVRTFRLVWRAEGMRQKAVEGLRGALRRNGHDVPSLLRFFPASRVGGSDRLDLIAARLLRLRFEMSLRTPGCARPPRPEIRGRNQPRSALLSGLFGGNRSLHIGAEQLIGRLCKNQKQCRWRRHVEPLEEDVRSMQAWLRAHDVKPWPHRPHSHRSTSYPV